MPLQIFFRDSLPSRSLSIPHGVLSLPIWSASNALIGMLKGVFWIQNTNIHEILGAFSESRANFEEMPAITFSDFCFSILLKSRYIYEGEDEDGDIDMCYELGKSRAGSIDSANSGTSRDRVFAFR